MTSTPLKVRLGDSISYCGHREVRQGFALWIYEKDGTSWIFVANTRDIPSTDWIPSYRLIQSPCAAGRGIRLWNWSLTLASMVLRRSLRATALFPLAKPQLVRQTP